MLGDIAVLTGGTFISEDLGRQLESVEVAELGRAKKIIVTKDDTTIIEGAGKKGEIQGRAAQIKSQWEKSTSDYDREKLMERLAKLTSGVAMIQVGGASELEMKANKDLVDDALRATRCAAKEGYVPGGGVALLRTQDAIRKAAKAAVKATDDEKIGYEIVAKAVESCAKQIAENAGKSRNPSRPAWASTRRPATTRTWLRRASSTPRSSPRPRFRMPRRSRA
jgi:chaperonin GroEL